MQVLWKIALCSTRSNARSFSVVSLQYCWQSISYLLKLFQTCCSFVIWRLLWALTETRWFERRYYCSRRICGLAYKTPPPVNFYSWCQRYIEWYNFKLLLPSWHYYILLLTLKTKKQWQVLVILELQINLRWNEF